MKTTLLLGSAVLALPLGLLALPRPARAPAAAAPASEAATYKIDSGHSSVVFRVQHLGTSWFYGRFNRISGEVQWDPENPSAGSIEIEIPADSIDTASERRDNHLKSPDFFNAKEFPVLTFKSTKVDGDEKALKVTGDLTMHGVTKSITVEASLTGTSDFPRQGPRAGFAAEFTVRRGDFGMSYMAPDMLGDDVTILLGLECVKQ